MRQVLIAVLLVACGNPEEAGREAAQQRAAQEAPATAPPPPMQKGTPDVAKAPPAPPTPEPTTPAEIDHARNQAMIDGRDKDVLKYCAMAKLDDKSNPQALLGCTLSACRIKDADNAHLYSKALKKDYMVQAQRICAPAGVTL
jgi:hypothetical protein